MYKKKLNDIYKYISEQLSKESNKIDWLTKKLYDENRSLEDRMEFDIKLAVVKSKLEVFTELLKKINK
jgi:hypothetical protein